jgi:hypothetical protein
MIPGKVGRLSESTVVAAATIKAETDVVVATGAVGINTITPTGLNQSQLLFLITPVAVIIGTSGNILVGLTTTANRATVLLWSKSLQKWSIVSGL